VIIHDVGKSFDVGLNHYLISVWLDIDCPLMGMAIFFSLLAEVSSNVTIYNRLDDADPL
jgi:hypothetical protein